MNGVSGGYHINGCGEQLYVKSLSLLFSGSVSCYCIACVSGNQLTLFAPMSTKFSQLKEVNLEASRFFHHIMPLYISSSSHSKNFLLLHNFKKLRCKVVQLRNLYSTVCFLNFKIFMLTRISPRICSEL